MKQDDFVTKAIESSEENDIDMLAIEWLNSVANEYGSDGLTAKKLLCIVCDLLCINN